MDFPSEVDYERAYIHALFLEGRLSDSILKEQQIKTILLLACVCPEFL